MSNTQPARAKRSSSSLPPPLDLPRHPMVVSIGAQTGRDRHQVVGLLVELAVWSVSHQIDLQAAPPAVEVLVELIGGDTEFWAAVASVGWLMIEDAGEKKQTSIPGDADGPIPFDPNACEHRAAKLFRSLKYSGNDGSLLWRVAMLVEARLLPQACVADAAEGARQLAKRNPVGYFRRSLAELCEQKGIDLDLALRRCRLPPGYSGPPVPLTTGGANGVDIAAIAASKSVQASPRFTADQIRRQLAGVAEDR